MSSRFLYTGPDGKAVQIPSTKALRVAVEAGEIDGDTLLFDSLTDVWAPAHTLSIYRLALEASAEARDDGSPESDEAPPSLGTLAVDDVELDATVDEFVRRAEREREQAAALDPAAGLDLAVVRDETIPEIDADATASEPVEAPLPRVDESGPASKVRRSDPRPRPHPGTDVPPPPDSGAVAPRTLTPVGNDGLRRVALIGALIAVGGWGIADAWATSAESLPEEALLLGSARSGIGVDVPEGVLVLRESARGAFEDMALGMERIRSRLGIEAPPTSWLSGRYLSDPASAPEVLDYWTTYEAFVDSLRMSEEDLFRSGFVTRLQESGITGPVLSIRLASGLSDFRADRARRESVYEAMEELAAEARELDDYLRANTDRIAYAGVRAGAVSKAPGIEAVPLDEATREGLNAQLDRLFEAMDRVTGMDPSRARDLTGTAFEQLAGRE
jgi:hypothetical protein